MEELLPGIDPSEARHFFVELYDAHAETREERLGNVFEPGGAQPDAGRLTRARRI